MSTINNGSFCEYRSTDYVSLRKTKEIKNRKQDNSKYKDYSQIYQEYKALRSLQKEPKITIEINALKRFTVLLYFKS